jgi:hypothetical protein
LIFDFPNATRATPRQALTKTEKIASQGWENFFPNLEKK